MDERVRVLMVTPYPPARDGIGAYALQEVRALRAEGHDVEVLSPYPSAAQHHLDLRGPRGAIALAKRVRRYDKLVVQFHPDVFYPLPRVDDAWVLENLALQVPFRMARRLEVRVHEVDYRDGRRRGPLGITSRLLWRTADRIGVHTSGERDAFIEAFGVEASRVTLCAHGANFERYTTSNRVQAKRSLGLSDDATVFLSIGFVQPHKGFDRAVRAFSGLAKHGCRLDIVGSPRLEDPANQVYVDELQTLADNTPGVELHLDYVSDEMFDRWLLASDVVVLPYRLVWSSSVLERAALYDRPVIATAVGGLAEQSVGRSDVTFVTDDLELARAMWAFAGVDASAARAAIPWPTDGAGSRSAVQAAVLGRAAARRGRTLVPSAAAKGSMVATHEASSPLRSLGGAGVPEPTSGRPLRGLLKRLVRRLTAWEIEPLVAQVNALHAAAASAVDLAEQSPAGGSRVSDVEQVQSDGSQGSPRSFPGVEVKSSEKPTSYGDADAAPGLPGAV